MGDLGQTRKQAANKCIENRAMKINKLPTLLFFNYKQYIISRDVMYLSLLQLLFVDRIMHTIVDLQTYLHTYVRTINCSQPLNCTP